MPTTVHLTDGTSVSVEQEPEEVRHLLTEDLRRREPFTTLKEHGHGDEIWVNASAIVLLRHLPD